MKLGLNLPTLASELQPAELVDLCVVAESAGFHQAWVGEHVVLADAEANEYFPATASMPDPFTLLAAIASVTSTLRLGTGVCLPAQRNPVYLAKVISTLDWLSQGRLDVGMGLGWSAAELESVGVTAGERSARFRDWVEVLRHLWNDENHEREWPTFRLPAVRQYPRPAQAGGPPLWVGGNSDAALRRAAVLGDGWYGFGDLEDDTSERVATLQRLARECGRGPIRVALLTYRVLENEELALWRDLGVEQVVVSLSGQDRSALVEEMHTAAERFRASPAAQRR